jgi:hypothetical protein
VPKAFESWRIVARMGSRQFDVDNRVRRKVQVETYKNLVAVKTGAYLKREREV